MNKINYLYTRLTYGQHPGLRDHQCVLQQLTGIKVNGHSGSVNSYDQYRPFVLKAVSLKFRIHTPFMNLFRFSLLAVLTMLVCLCPAQTGGRDFKIRVHPEFNGETLVLETRKYVSPANDTLQFERFRFYLSSIELVFEDGKVYKEAGSYHLVDLEEPSTLQLHLLHVPAGKITSVKFNIGVDSIKSVSGAMDGDLDPRFGMYWAWNSGYINAKLEGTSRSCKAYQNRFEFHIGGYSFPENSLRTVKLDLAQPLESDQLTLAADAQAWFNGVQLGKLPGVMIPGREAMMIADNYRQMFKVK